MSGERPMTLDAATLEEIYAHAREGYPEEVCGFVVRGGGEPEAARRCVNRQNALHAEDPARFPRDARTAYNLGPDDLRFLDKSLRGPRKVEIVYHSHVEVGSYFSDEDVRAALFDGEPLYPVDWLVVDVRKQGARGARLFRFLDGTFREVARFGDV